MTPADVTRRQVLGSAGLATAGLAGCLSDGDGSPAPVTFTDGFEGGLSGWETDSDVPADPNHPGQAVAWRIERSTERAASGSASLRYLLDGRQDDGTIWVVRPVTVDPGRAYDVSMRAAGWSASESFNTLAHLVLFAGPSRPADEGSFPAPGANSTGAGVTPVGGLREPLNQAAGWRNYAFTWQTPELESGTLAIAVGITAVWETELTYFVDDVELMAEPR